MDLIDLERFKLEGLLGWGSDYEVHAATDLETGKQVVLKRPNPDYVTRKLHHAIDRLSQQLIEVHRAIDDSTSHIAHLVGYTEVTQHDSYFRDSLRESYRVLVEERAQGLPLACDIRDKFKGAPVGLGQNLFALHVLVPHPDQSYFAVHHQLMEVEEAFHRAGHLLLDIRPQNVYFDPADTRITVIDIGTIPAQGPLSQGRASMGDQPKDLHDFYLEMFQFYATPDSPHPFATAYGEPVGMRAIPHFSRQIDNMVQSFSKTEDSRLGEASVAVLRKIQKRGYSSFEEFRRDFSGYLDLVRERNDRILDLRDLVKVWKQAMEMLYDNYWRKFLFNPESDLAHYRNT